MSKLKLKVALVQLNPIIGSLKENTERGLLILDKAFPSTQTDQHPDLVVFPELAFTGYNFTSKNHIAPYLETARTGHSSNIAALISKKYHCYTVIGYPETASDKIYNSAIVSSPTGEFVHNYRKTHLYDTDEVWGASESDVGFSTFELKFQLPNGSSRRVTSSIGICMDLNPYKFEAPFMDFEFASHCLANKTPLIICPMNWLLHDSPSLKDTEREKIRARDHAREVLDNLKLDLLQFQINESQNQDEIKHYLDPTTEHDPADLCQPDVSNVNYWILRFFPFLNYLKVRQSSLKPVVLLNNRSGLEDTVQYAGSSLILQFQDSMVGSEFYDSRNESVKVLGYLGQSTEGVLVRDIEI